MRTCNEIRRVLPSLLYGDLDPGDEAAARDHLAGCPACRAEQAALEHVRAGLDALPAPPAQVDLPRLYEEAARRQELRLRRWRRAALALGAAAAVLLAVVGLGLEVRIDGHQVTLRWGTPPEGHAFAPPAPAPPEPSPVTADDLILMKKLIHALAADVAARDEEQRRAVQWVEQRLDALHTQVIQHREATRRDVSALYTAQFGSRDKGD